MNLPPLPELPEPDGSAAVVVGTVPSGPMMADVEKYADAWSREKVEAYALAYGRAVVEACAKVCDDKAFDWITRGPTENWEYRAHGAEDCAEAIRNGVIREGEGEISGRATPTP